MVQTRLKLAYIWYGRVRESNPDSRVLISTATVKTLIACAMQAITRQIIQIDVVICADTIKYIYFPFSLFLKT